MVKSGTSPPAALPYRQSSRGAAAAEGEIGRPLERPQRCGVEVTCVEGVEDGSDARGPLGHPRWRRTLGRRRWVDAGRKLEALKPCHELVGGSGSSARKLCVTFLLRSYVVSAHAGSRSARLRSRSLWADVNASEAAPPAE